jgi:hypothetical protein
VDVGPTSLPAYPATTAQVRSLKVPAHTLEAGAKPYWQLGEDVEPSWYLGKREEQRSTTPRPAWQLGKEDEDYWYLGKREEGRHARAVTR